MVWWNQQEMLSTDYINEDGIDKDLTNGGPLRGPLTLFLGRNSKLAPLTPATAGSTPSSVIASLDFGGGQ